MTPKHPSDTIGRALSFAAAELRSSGNESARLDAELLLGFMLSKSRTQLAVDANEPIDPTVVPEFESLLLRRISGESVAYIVGSRAFFGHDLAVGPGVLVPRPETELLVEWAINTIGRLWPSQSIRVLDLCTGSGAIALSLAFAFDLARVSVAGSDISAEALDYARRNRRALGLERHVDLVEGDLLAWTEGPWDMILSNPPYLRPDQVDDNPDLLAEPRLALDGGRDGLELIEQILDQAVAVVAKTFAMMIEIDPDQADAVYALASGYFPGADVIIVPDLTGRARFVAIERKELVL